MDSFFLGNEKEQGNFQEYQTSYSSSQEVLTFHLLSASESGLNTPFYPQPVQKIALCFQSHKYRILQNPQIFVQTGNKYFKKELDNQQLESN